MYCTLALAPHTHTCIHTNTYISRTHTFILSRTYAFYLTQYRYTYSLSFSLTNTYILSLFSLFLTHTHTDSRIFLSHTQTHKNPLAIARPVLWRQLRGPPTAPSATLSATVLSAVPRSCTHRLSRARCRFRVRPRYFRRGKFAPAAALFEA